MTNNHPNEPLKLNQICFGPYQFNPTEPLKSNLSPNMTNNHPNEPLKLNQIYLAPFNPTEPLKLAKNQPTEPLKLNQVVLPPNQLFFTPAQFNFPPPQIPGPKMLDPGMFGIKELLVKNHPTEPLKLNQLNMDKNQLNSDKNHANQPPIQQSKRQISKNSKFTMTDSVPMDQLSGSVEKKDVNLVVGLSEKVEKEVPSQKDKYTMTNKSTKCKEQQTETVKVIF